MKYLLIIIFLSVFNLNYSQSSQQSPPNTEVYLFDLKMENGKILLSNVKNISDNPGYDNQPSFLDEDYLLFASTRNGQTDIAKYYMKYNSKTWLNFTPGSEYSPLKIPAQDAVSAIKLEADGTQALFKYSLNTGASQVLVEDIIIGYQLWYDENTLISSVLENDMLNLYKTDIRTGIDTKLVDNIGRSLHKIPNSDRISYISKTNPDKWEIRSIDINSGRSSFINNTLDGSEDMIWLKNGSIVMGNGSKLLINSGGNWKEWADIEHNGIGNITRLAIDADETKLAVVGESNGAIISNDDPSETSGTGSGSTTGSDYKASEVAAVVQSHIAPFNKGNLEEFLAPFADNVVVGRFPAEVRFKGKDNMRESYRKYFKNNKNLSVTVNKRIVLKNIVLDEELATQNTETHRQVTIYTVDSGKIQSMIFIQNEEASPLAEQLVNEQIEAYNRRDIDEFMNAYSNDVKLYNFPDQLRTDGAAAMKESYQQFFERTPDLRGVVQNRMIIGNKVIDQEHVTINGQILNAVAIYEIENNKIVRVTFIQ